MTTLDERLQHVVAALRYETVRGLGEQLDEFCERMEGLAAAVHEARALLKANLTSGHMNDELTLLRKVEDAARRLREPVGYESGATSHDLDDALRALDEYREPMSEAWKNRDRPCPPCPDCGTELYEAFWGNGVWARTDKLTGKTHHESDCVRILKAKLAHKGTL